METISYKQSSSVPETQTPPTQVPVDSGPPASKPKAPAGEGVNKYFILIGIALLIVVAGVVYRVFLLPESSKPQTSGVVKNFTVIAKKDEWKFIPEEITVERGDRVILEVVNEDDYDHGIAIDALGVSQRMPANQTIRVEFVVTQEGEFPFYCSVPCGEGEVDGDKRTHFDMIGTIKVKKAMQPIQ